MTSDVGLTMLDTSNLKLRKLPEAMNLTYDAELIVAADVALTCHAKGE